MKVIHISPFVRKFTAADFINLKDDDWSVKTARAILKQTKKYEIECWAVSSKIDGINVIKKKRAIIKIFPAKEWVYKKGHSRLLIKELKNELKKDTIIHLHGYHNYIAYSIISSLKNKPIIAQDHGENHPLDLIRRNGKFFFLFPLLLIEELIERIIFKNINQFFALTKKEMKYLSKFINKDKIKHQTMGVDFNLFKPFDKKKARNKFDLPLNKKIILSVGVFEKRKGLDYLIKALPIAIKQIPNLLLVIVGRSGPSERHLKNLVVGLNLTGYVRFLDFVQYEKMPYIYSAVDVLALTSLDEGAPVSIMEALSCGVPVMATRVGNVKDMVSDFRNGLVVKPKDINAISDAIITFFKNQNRFKDCRKTAVAYDWNFIAKNTIKVYKKLLP
ncbi:glycosyltransferase family 4 protein [Candidatus Woesearchaeota archaeon]|nr:glycosyltransferase family 4 protein [Candidatus Woesearchaeota archaeon]